MTRLPTTVVLAAEAPLRERWRAELDTEADVVVVGQNDLPGVLMGQVIDLMPDVVLVSTDLPTVDVVALCTALTETVPVCRVILVSGQLEAPYDAVAAGAAGAVTEADLVGRVATVVRRTARGEGQVTQQWAETVLQSDMNARLTATEREVLQRVAKGATIDAVAGLHEVPPRLVHLHAGYALAKVHRTAEDERRASGRG